MTLKDVGETIAKYAPLLGAVLPVPGGLVLGQAVASLFGGNVNSPDDLIKRIQNDPDAAMKLRQFELNHQLELEKLAVQSFELEVKDKASARERDVKALESGDHTTRNIAYIFSYGYFIFLFIFMYLIYYDAINKEESILLKEILDKLTIAYMLILSFYFGASYALSKYKREG